jgi:hypothetical protein
MSPVPGVVPNFTTVAPVKPVPVMVTGVPPVVGPELGLTAVTVGTGGGLNVNWSAGAFTTEVPPGVVTVTSTVAAASAGDVIEIEVEELTMSPVPGVVPNFTTVAPVKPVPVTVTGVPPVVGPELGLTAVTVGTGGGLKVNWSGGAFTTEVPPGVVTVTSTVAAASAGEVMEIEVEELTTRPVPGVVPNFTTVAPVKPVPVTVTGVPPVVGPDVGLTAVTVGTGGGAPFEALSSTPTAVDTPAGDWVALGATVPETTGS